MAEIDFYRLCLCNVSLSRLCSLSDLSHHVVRGTCAGKGDCTMGSNYPEVEHGGRVFSWRKFRKEAFGPVRGLGPLEWGQSTLTENTAAGSAIRKFHKEESFGPALGPGPDHGCFDCTCVDRYTTLAETWTPRCRIATVGHCFGSYLRCGIEWVYKGTCCAAACRTVVALARPVW